MANLAKKSNKTTAIVSFEDEMAQYAQVEADRAQTPSGSFVSLKGGILAVAGNAVKDNKMLAIVVDSVYENHLYEGKYNPDVPSSPVCFAFGKTVEGMAPHEKSPSPQSETCEGCPHNVFGTADDGKGKGKACKNVRRLALIPVGDADAVKDAEAFYMKLPVTSGKNWDYYTKALNAAMRRPPFAVETEIGLAPDPKTQFKVTFQPGDPLAQDVVQAVMAKRDEVQEQLVAPYSPVPEVEAPPPTKPQKFAGRARR